MKPTKNEHCVVCDVEVSIDIDTPIEQRIYYIEGIGQLCRQCYEELTDEE